MSTVIDGSASVTINNGAVLGITRGTAVASTSGVSVDFTSIPSWVKRITVMFSGVNYSASTLQIQSGAGSIENTGYQSSMTVNSGTTVTTSNITSGYSVTPNAGSPNSGLFIMTLIGSNTWVAQVVTNAGGANSVVIAAGTKTFSGVIDRVRITTVSGAGTFSAGSINIMYEG
jgi:hypothetical protein